VVEDLIRLRLPSPEVTDWFRTALTAAFADITEHQRRQAATLAKRRTELKTMQDRLLNAYLGGMVDEEAFRGKSEELKGEEAKVRESLDRLAELDPKCGEAALALFDWAQNAAETWRGSNNAARREILDFVCLNRILSDVNLYGTKRKPFDVLAEGPKTKESRGDPFQTSLDITPEEVSRVA
jgi:hypothetical protein